MPVPPHRFTPLKENWMKIFTPIVEHLKLQIRLNLKTRNVEIKVCMCLMFRVHPGTLYIPLGHLDTYPSCKRDFV